MLKQDAEVMGIETEQLNAGNIDGSLEDVQEEFSRQVVPIKLLYS